MGPTILKNMLKDIIFLLINTKKVFKTTTKHKLILPNQMKPLEYFPLANKKKVIFQLIIYYFFQMGAELKKI